MCNFVHGQQNDLLFIHFFIIILCLLVFNVFMLIACNSFVTFLDIFFLQSVNCVHLCCFCESFPCALWLNEEDNNKTPLIARIIHEVGNRMYGRPDTGVIVNSTNTEEHLPKRPPIFITVSFIEHKNHCWMKWALIFHTKHCSVAAFERYSCCMRTKCSIRVYRAMRPASIRSMV